MTDEPAKPIDQLQAALRLIGDRVPGDPLVLYTASLAQPLSRKFVGAGVETLTSACAA